MNQFRFNEYGLSELMGNDLRKIEALARTAQYLLLSRDSSVYTREVAELVSAIQDYTADAQAIRAEWVNLSRIFGNGGVR